jgi:hypothetical protein
MDMHKVVTEGLVEVDDDTCYLDIEFCFSEHQEHMLFRLILFTIFRPRRGGNHASDDWPCPENFANLNCQLLQSPTGETESG